MFGRNPTRQRQSGGAGFGFRGSSPPYPYIGRGRGGLPRCQYPGNIFPARNIYTSEQELDILKRQAGDIRKELDIIESRIRDIEAKKKE